MNEKQFDLLQEAFESSQQCEGDFIILLYIATHQGCTRNDILTKFDKNHDEDPAVIAESWVELGYAIRKNNKFYLPYDVNN